jgi:AbiU2
MATTRTADEVRADFMLKMGADFGAFWDAFRNELIVLHAKWQQYRKLYGTSDERIGLLNSSAGFFFGLVHDVMWDDIVLHIARLTGLRGLLGTRSSRSDEFRSLSKTLQ